MTIDKNNVVKIPTWLIAVILPLVVSAISAIVVSNATGAVTRRQVEINTEQLKEKVNKAEFLIIREQLNRIEDKVDNYNYKTKKPYNE